VDAVEGVFGSGRTPAAGLHWSIASCYRMKMRKILNLAANYTRFEAIFLAGLRKGGMPEE
jgi:hypothetical protein